MPAAAVIPAPIAYINVVAVKKLVVGFRDCDCGEPGGFRGSFLCSGAVWAKLVTLDHDPLYVVTVS